MTSLKCEKPSKKLIFILLVLLVVILLVCVLLATHLRLKGRDDCPSGVHCDWKAVPRAEFLKDERCGDVCSSGSCIRSAEYSLRRIDPSQDPCEDFYQFACGAFAEGSQFRVGQAWKDGESTDKEIERDFLLDIKDVVDAIPIDKTGQKKGAALRFVKKFYNSCRMGKEALFDDQTTNFLKELFGVKGKLPWPLINKDSTNSNFKLEAMMAYLSAVSGNPLFDAQLIQRSRSEWLIEMEIPKYGVLSNIYAEAKEQELNKTELYLNAMFYVLELMGVEETTAVRTVRDTAAFEKKIIEEAKDADFHSSPGRQDAKFSCKEMEERFRSINWCSFASHFLPLLGVSGDVPVVFRVDSMPYFQAMNRNVDRAIGRTLVNYLNTKFLLTFQKYLTQRFQYYHYLSDEVFPKATIYRTATSYWQRCLVLTAEQLWPVLHDQYVKSKFDSSKQQKVDEMIDVMNATMLSAMESFSWMQEEDRKELAEQFKQRLYDTSFRKAVPSQDQLDKLFSMMSSEMKSFIEDALDLMKLKNKISFSSKLNPHLFKITEPFFIDNYNHPNLGNHIYGFRYFRFPLLDLDRPKYLDYSTLGTVVTFPMTKTLLETHFSSGQKDTPEEMDVVLERNECINEHFSSYGKGQIVPNDTIEVFNNLFETLSLQSSYKAYENYLCREGEEKGLPGLPLTNRQLFFISYAQLLCDNRSPHGYDTHRNELARPDVRINGALSQSPEFGKAFRCTDESRMNPGTKCCIIASKTESTCK